MLLFNKIILHILYFSHLVLFSSLSLSLLYNFFNFFGHGVIFSFFFVNYNIFIEFTALFYIFLVWRIYSRAKSKVWAMRLEFVPWPCGVANSFFFFGQQLRTLGLPGTATSTSETGLRSATWIGPPFTGIGLIQILFRHDKNSFC